MSDLVVLDFGTIVNPARLLQCLVTLPPAGVRLATGEYNLSVELVADGVGRGMYCDLHRPETCGDFDTWFDRQSLSFDDSNVFLAVQMLRHAFRRGLIELLPRSPRGAVAGLIGAELQSAGASSMLPMRNLVAGPGGRVEVCPDLGSWSWTWDLQHSVNAGAALASNDRFANWLVGGTLAGRLFRPLAQAEHSSTIAAWKPSELDEILAAIDYPHLLPSLTEAMARIWAEEAYRKELRLFLPQWGLDAATGGLSSLVTMLCRILTRKRTNSA